MANNPKNLTKRQRDALSPRLKQVWCSVFAAEWHYAFISAEELNGFDHEDDFDHAERAATMADRAVYQLRDWEAQ